MQAVSEILSIMHMGAPVSTNNVRINLLGMFGFAEAINGQLQV